MDTIRRELLDAIRAQAVISSHCHHLPDDGYTDMSLKKVLENSYTSWMSPPPLFTDKDAVRAYIQKYRCNSFFHWMFRALEELYGIPFTPETAADLDTAVRTAHTANPHRHLDILRRDCRFERVINERQPDPGSDLGHPDLFSPSFRCDCFFAANLKDKAEPNGFYAYSLFDDPHPASFDDYLDAMDEAIRAKKRAGIAALKVAIAYERPLDFEDVPAQKAAKAFNNPDATSRELKDFGDAVMFRLARAAADCALPVQIHTGMGQCRATNPMQLLTLIEHNPDTTFHLLHGGFPWLDDTYALLLQFKHVYSDTCWMPYLSSSMAAEYLVRAWEVADAHRFTWGCDAWMSEDSYGALLAMEHTLVEALTRMIASGAADFEYAVYLAERVMYANAKDLFGV